MSLWSDFITNNQRLIHKWTHYFPICEDHFVRYVDRPMVFLEIGCGEGGSLQLWKRHLGPFAQIVGIDIVETCRDFEGIRSRSRADTFHPLDTVHAFLRQRGRFRAGAASAKACSADRGRSAPPSRMTRSCAYARARASRARARRAASRKSCAAAVEANSPGPATRTPGTPAASAAPMSASLSPMTTA